MFSLKSELFKKQQELTSKKSASSAAEVIRKQHKLKTAGNADDAKIPEYEKNAGVEERNARDLAQTDEEKDKSRMVKSVLEAKTKLYEKMTSGDVLPDEESSAIFLVDFEKKSIGARMKRKDVEKKPKLGVNVASQLASEIDKASNVEEEWVEYTDGLGRTRTCLRKDLPEMKRIDRKLGITNKTEKKGEKTLLSDDMRREMEREKWEEEALEEVNGPVHYENLRGGEIRELGVGYFTFSTDQETRDKQIKMLQKMREETEKEKRHLRESEKRKRTALQARLERVRVSRIKKLKSQGKEIPTELLKPIELPQIEEKRPDSDVTTTSAEVEVTKRDDSDRPVREWDEGKEWTPAESPKAPKSWSNPREERPDEFAPPSFYYKGRRSKQVIAQDKLSEIDEPLLKDEDSSLSVDNKAPSSEQIRENPSDLISRIRKELSEVAKSSLTSADAAVTSSGDKLTAALPTDPDESQASSSEKISVDSPNTVATSCSDNNNPVQSTANLYFPCPDKPVTMKVKVLPKKSSVLQTKSSAFSDD